MRPQGTPEPEGSISDPHVPEAVGSSWPSSARGLTDGEGGEGRVADLGRRTATALRWSAGGELARQVLRLGLALVLTRLLTPEDYGLVGMSAVFLGLATLLGEFGLSTALIQRRELRPDHLDTVFWIQVGTGLVFGSALFVAAPAISALYGEPRVRVIVMVTALNFLLTAVGPVQRALLTRNLRFKATVFVDSTALAVSAVVAFGLAASGAGVWSLVAQGLVNNLVTSIALVLVVRWRPHGWGTRRALAELWAFSGHLLGFRTLNYGFRNSDNLLVGRYLGEAALGLYTRAYMFLLLPTRSISAVVGRVMFSSLSALQDDPARVKRVFLRTEAMIALVTVPMMGGLALVSQDFVAAAFGPRWSELAPILSVFAVVGLTESIASPVGWIYQSQGKTAAFFRWGMLVSAVVMTGVVLGIVAGSPRSVALGYAAASAALTYPGLMLAGRLIGLRAYEVLRVVAGPVGCGAVMAIAVILVGRALPAGIPAVAALMAKVTVGSVVYIALVLVTMSDKARELSLLIRPARAGRGG